MYFDLWTNLIEIKLLMHLKYNRWPSSDLVRLVLAYTTKLVFLCCKKTQLYVFNSAQMVSMFFLGNNAINREETKIV